MKKTYKFNILLASVISSFILLAGCSSGIFGKSSKSVEHQANKIESIKKEIIEVNDSKINQVSQLSYGMDYSLSKVTNTEPAVEVTKKLNDIVQSLVGLPPVEQQKKTIEMVSNLILDNERGKRLLDEKYKEVNKIQIASIELIKEKNKEVDRMSQLAKDVALKQDTTQAQLDDLKGNWGLNAIVFGFKTLITRLLWTVVILSVLYIILRFAAMSNPIAASIFSIFNIIGSWFINIIKTLAPDSVKQAGHVPLAVFNSYSDTLTKLVDVIQMQKEKGNTSIAPISTEVAKSFNEENTSIVSGIKKKLLY